jgi:hypothetical protein
MISEKAADVILSKEIEPAYSVADVLIDEEKYIRPLIPQKAPRDDARAPEAYLEIPVDDAKIEGKLPAQPPPKRYSNPKADPRSVIGKLEEFRAKRAEKSFQRDALCLSGGGIRSACISLGVVQGLSSRELLRKFHYLSTVSGGGYLGCWLSTWISALRRPRFAGNAREVEHLMSKPDKGVEAPEIRNLRTNSNYLTPRVGALSVDLFACIMIIVRNLIVNWLVLIPFFAACLALVMIVLLIGSNLIDKLNGHALLPGVAAVTFLGLNGLVSICVMPIFKRARKEAGKFGEMSTEYKRLMACRWGLTLLASFSMAIWFHAAQQPVPEHFFLLSVNNDYLIYWPVYALFLVPYLLGCHRACVASSDAAVDRKDPFFWPQLLLAFTASSALSYAAARGLIYLFCPVPQAVLNFFHPVASLFGHTLYLTFAPAIWILIIELQNFLMIGCLSMVTNDEDREWWSRSNGVTVLLGLGWFAACLVTACGPALYYLFIVHKTELLAALASQFTFGGILALMSSSSKTPATTQDKPAPLRLGLLQVGAIVFFVFLAMLLATANYEIILSYATPIHPTPITPLAGTRPLPVYPPPLPLGVLLSGRICFFYWCCLFALWAFISAAASWMININQFSLQCLYRNRLMRCFVGAVRRTPAAAAQPHEFEPFTGFDTTDNYEVSSLRFQLPFHVINMAQNLIKTTNLAWQQRMACSFTVTPLHTGGEITGYRRTHDFGKDISIGTAIATSGAAANPSMGHATSPILELVMGLFNARLGWWVGNPASKSKRWKEIGPRFALQPLLSEMFGQTSEGQDYVLLSDGGHFEDLAIYEMIQRRCRFLLVVDGGADPTGNFEDLGNAVRKVRIDLGVEIDFIFNRTTPALADTMDKRQHFAVAKIVYSDTDGTKAEEDGWLLYIKCNLNGDESQDIYQYKQFYSDFPHQTTLDQWFDESQFESYRALGKHSMERTLDALANYRSFKRMFAADPAPGAVSDEELGTHKNDFKVFLDFMHDREFI